RRSAAPLDAVTAAAPRALTAARELVDTTGPLLTQLRPFARQLLPIVQFTMLYRQEAVQSWLQTAAATNAVANNQNGVPVHYLRAPAVFPNEALIGATTKAPYSRSNPYMAPGGIDELAKGGLKTFSCGNTGNPQTTPPLVQPVPPCREQGPIPFQGRSASYPQVHQAP
ncbi:MAG: hypothetical protein JWO02_3920, partial [Solirubrobacterales bacterium]|nr:hypothetical protein [Solirubrobacterales bacterium]